MGSTAYDANGEVPINYSIPWGAVRKAWLKYKDIMHVVTKITLSGVTYNIGKQAKEGLVVIGNGYSSVAFFLPDDKDAMTAENGAAMSIYDWLSMIGNTDYAEVAAWDYFADFVGSAIRGIANNSDTEIPPDIAYSFNQVTGNAQNISLSGRWDFSTVTSAQEFFMGIFSGLDESSRSIAQESALSGWMESDGAIHAYFTVEIDAENQMPYEMWIGRK